MRNVLLTLGSTACVLLLGSSLAGAASGPDRNTAAGASTDAAREALLSEARQLTVEIDRALAAKSGAGETEPFDAATLPLRTRAYRLRALQMGRDPEVVAALVALEAKLRDLIGGTCPTTTPSRGVSAAGASVNGRILSPLSGTGSISGKITNESAAGIASATVQLYDCQGYSIAAIAANGSGDYTFSSLDAGTYYIYAAKSGFVGKLYAAQLSTAYPYGSTVTTNGTAIPVGSGAVTGINLALPAGGGITGAVTQVSPALPLTGTQILVYSAVGSYLATAISGAGTYTVPSILPSGTYYLRTSTDATHIAQVYNSFNCLGSGYCNVLAGTPVSVTAGSVTPGINFALNLGGRIKGTITNAVTLAAVSGVSVQIYNSQGNQVASGTSDGTGAYTTSPGLPTGTYYAATSNSAGLLNEAYNNVPCAGCTVPAVGTAISVTAPSDTLNVNFALNPGGSITGTITGPGAVPVTSGAATIYSSVGNYMASGSTNGSGFYTASGLATGTYYVVADDYSDNLLSKIYGGSVCTGNGCNLLSGTLVSVTAGSTTPNINVTLPAAGKLQGTVTGAGGTPLGGINVYAYDSTGSYASSTSTDCTGHYEMTGLLTGSYYTRTYNYQQYRDEAYDDVDCPGGACAATTGDPVAVTQGSTTSNINFSLALGARVKGTVRDAATLRPLPGVPVELSGPVSTTLYSGDDGVYRSSYGLPPGTYHARTNNSLGYFDRIYSGLPCTPSSCDVSSGSAIVVTGVATTSGVDFSLTAGGRIRGLIVSAADGLPLSASVAISTDTGASAAFVGADSAGRYFTSHALAAGSYRARISSVAGGYLPEAYNNVACPAGGCSATTGTLIAVGSGTVSGINFPLDKGGRIAGTIVDSVTAAPLNGVTLYIYGSTGTFVTSAYTDSTGKYLTNVGLPAGNYYVRTSNGLGYLDQLYSGISCTPSCTPTSGTAVAVVLAATTGGINFNLVRGGRISGTVNSASGPAAYASVVVYDSSGNGVDYPSTDADGHYITAVGLQSGTYYLTASDSDGGLLAVLYNGIPCALGCTVTTGTPVSVTLGATTSGIDFVLPPGGRISGTVTDANTSAPVAGAYVYFHDADDNYATAAYTDASGHYLTIALPAGGYHAYTSNSAGYMDELYADIDCSAGCSLGSGTTIVVAAGATTTGINFALTLGGKISGTVTNANTAAPVASVYIYAYDPSGAYRGSASTNGLGTYTIQGLGTGTYYLVTSNSVGYINQVYAGISCIPSCPSTTTGNPVAVSTGATTSGINFALVAGGRIGGTITDSVSSTPLSGVTVYVYSSTGSYQASVNTNASGVYLTGVGLPAGNYYVRTTNSLGYLNELYNNLLCSPSCTVTTGTPVAVALGATTSGIDFALARGGRISGTITNQVTSAPLSNVTVYVYNSAGTFVSSGSSNGTGAYTTGDGLLPGTYYAKSSSSQGLIDELYDNHACPTDASCPVTGGNPITVVGSNTTSGINFALSPGGRIAGRVTSITTGGPLVDVEVDFYNSSGNFAGYGYTGNDGTYVSYYGLATGTYYARTYNGNNVYRDKAFNGISIHGCYYCPATVWTPIAVTQGATTPNVDFALVRKNPARGDFNGNNRSDILWRNVGGPDTGALFVWLMNGASLSGGSYLSPISTDWVIQSVADFNGDGKADVLWRNMNPAAPDAGYLYVWLMNGASVIGAAYTNSQADFGWEVQGVGDLNGDGNADIVWRKVGPGPDTGAMFVWLMNGATIIGATYLDPISTDWHIQRIADFNGDGYADILWRNMNPAAPDAAKLYLWSMQGAGVIDADYTAAQADFGWVVQQVGDLDGNGQADIVWRKTGPGPDTGALFLWLMNGTGIVGAQYLDPISTDWQVQGVADFNGDGKGDILWRNVNPGAVDAFKLYIWMMSGPNVVAGTGYTNSQANAAWDVKNPR